MLISIVVPIYNAEKYLEKCLDSIINQTYKELEIILINDASNDNSLAICKQYIEQDIRIELIDQNQNYGVSRARNDGIKIAKGEYILFIDSDDTVDFDYVEKLTLKAKQHRKDLIVCSYRDIYSENTLTNKIKMCLSGNICDDWTSILPFMKGPWGKLYKLSIIKDNNITFPENMTIAEDQVFNYRYAQHVKSYSVINSSFYNYFHRGQNRAAQENSIKFFEDRMFKLQSEYAFFRDCHIQGKTLINDDVFGYMLTIPLLDVKNNNYTYFKKQARRLARYVYFDEEEPKIKRVISLILVRLNLYIILYLFIKLKLRK